MTGGAGPGMMPLLVLDRDTGDARVWRPSLPGLFTADRATLVQMCAVLAAGEEALRVRFAAGGHGVDAIAWPYLEGTGAAGPEGAADDDERG